MMCLKHDLFKEMKTHNLY